MHHSRTSQEVQIGNIWIGGKNPIAIQAMTNTDTADIESTTKQIRELTQAGAEIVRITVMDTAGAKAVPYIKEYLLQQKCEVPLVGDFHFVGHRLLAENPECAQTLDKYRINPGNVGTGNTKDENFSRILEIALKHNKPVRIGVNAGSLDQALLSTLMEENSHKPIPLSDQDVFRQALIQSAILSAQFAEKVGVAKNKMVVSVKVSNVQDVIYCYQELAKKTDYCLHLGLTEAGSGDKGVVSSAAALAILLQQGIGDTLRISLTPEPKTPRSKEVEICKLLLQSMGYRQFRPFVTSCPGCGRTSSTLYQELAQKINQHIEYNMYSWKKKYPGIEKLNIAVMGCIVNGPGESRHADIGISLPGKAEHPQAPVYIQGKLHTTLKGNHIAEEFQQILDTYIQQHFEK